MMRLLAVLIFALALVTPVRTGSGHSGGLDHCGCHAGSRPYHCHRNPCRRCPSSFDCKGTLVVNTVPRGRVYVNGTYHGISPTKALRLQHGSVRIRVEHALLGKAERVVQVEYGKRVELDLRW